MESLFWKSKEDYIPENLAMGFVSKFHNKYQTGALQHLTATQIETEVGHDIFKRYFKFSVIRNPWDKAVSQYCYMKKNKYLRTYIGMHRFDSFAKYLKLITQKEHVQWMPQCKFLYDNKGMIMVDQVIRFESLNDGFPKILEKLNLQPVNLPHLNNTKRSDYSDYYSQDLTRVVEDFYHEDIERFGYTFGE